MWRKEVDVKCLRRRRDECFKSKESFSENLNYGDSTNLLVH